MEEDLKQLQRDIDLRNAQIADLQQKILDSDQGKTFSASLIIH
jgi:CHASE3 domain sensor protein